MNRGITAITTESFNRAYIELLPAIVEYGELEAKTRDLPNVNITLTNPADSLLLMKKNWKWAIQELFDRMSPWFFESDCERPRWNPGFAVDYRASWKRKLAKEGGTFDYSYGDHYLYQLRAVADLLKSKKTDREGLLTVWEPKYLMDRGDYQRRPCTLNIHLFKRGNKLNCNTYMRSNDVVNLLPYDILHHTFIQRFVAAYIGLELGYYSHTASHMYYPKRREIGGRDYFNRTIKGLEDNLDEFPDTSLELGNFKAIEESMMEYYIHGEDANPKNMSSPFIKALFLYLFDKKTTFFKFM